MRNFRLTAFLVLAIASMSISFGNQSVIAEQVFSHYVAHVANDAVVVASGANKQCSIYQSAGWTYYPAGGYWYRYVDFQNFLYIQGRADYDLNAPGIFDDAGVNIRSYQYSGGTWVLKDDVWFTTDGAARGLLYSAQKPIGTSPWSFVVYAFGRDYGRIECEKQVEYRVFDA